MADSIRQQIMDKIDARLKTIKTSAGYKTDIGANVFDWLDRDLAGKELDALIYRDRSAEIETETLELRNNRVRLEIEVKTKSGSTTAEQVREMIEDVYKAIAQDDTWDGLAIDTNPVSEEIEIGQNDKISGQATITVEIEYRTAKWEY
jgi:hypothetical protein